MLFFSPESSSAQLSLQGPAFGGEQIMAESVLEHVLCVALPRSVGWE